MVLRIEKLDRLFQLFRGTTGVASGHEKSGQTLIDSAPGQDFTVAGKAFAYKPDTVNIVTTDNYWVTNNDFTVIQKDEGSIIRATAVKKTGEERLSSFIIEERTGIKDGSRGSLNRRLIANVNYGENRIDIEYLAPEHQPETSRQELQLSATILASINLETGEIGNFQRTGQVRRKRIPLSDAEVPKYSSEIETLLKLLNESLPA